MHKRKVRILIVDDDESILYAVKIWLENKSDDFTVFTASTAEEALDIAEREWLHLIVIDIRLKKDPDDRSGIDLAKKMWSEVPKIFLTIVEDFNTARNGLSNKMKDEANVVAYVPKSLGEQELLDAISNVVNHLNLALDIQWGSYSRRMLIEMLKGYRQKDEEEKRAVADELDDLFCRLFHWATSVEMIDLKRGKGGCAVVRLRPTMSDGKGADVMVKFGPRETVMKEWDNYTKHVKNYVPHGATVIDDKPAQTLHLAAIIYSFVGGAGIEGAFKDYFSVATPESIEILLDYLFKETCARWYESGRTPKEDERLPLDQLYRSKDSLNLSDDKHLQEIESIVEQLLRPEDNLYAHNLQKSGETQLKVNLGRFVQLLPNPLYIALRERVGEEAATNLFPLPTSMAITHGDLNGDNIIVGKGNMTFLIDFYKTGFSPIFRDFVVLESIIKFELLQTSNLLQRYKLETALLEPLTFSAPIALTGMEQEHELKKVLVVIQRLRQLASGASLLDDMYEYYVGLLFYALREIVGFSSGPDEPACCNIKQYHALLSAAKICEKLLSMKSKNICVQRRTIPIFLSYASEDEVAVRNIYKRLVLEEFKPWMAPDDIFGGESSIRSIEQAIRKSDFFIPILSENSVDKRGVLQKESKQALDIWREKVARDIYIIPTRLDRCRIPEELATFQYVDLYKEGGWERLISAIREGVQRLDKQGGE